MSINTKKILISRRRHEFFVLRRRQCFQLFCERCSLEGEFLSLDDAVLISGFSTLEIVRRAEAGKIHFLESLSGLLVVCQKSLAENAASSIENYLKSGIQ